MKKNVCDIININARTNEIFRISPGIRHQLPRIKYLAKGDSAKEREKRKVIRMQVSFIFSEKS